jgi:hypothetical protein
VETEYQIPPRPQHFAKQSINLRFTHIFCCGFRIYSAKLEWEYPLISSRGARHRVLKRILRFSSISIHTTRLKSSLMHSRALEEITCQFYVTLFWRIIRSKNIVPLIS